MTGRSRSAGDRTVAVVFHEPVVGGASSGFLRIVPLLEDRGWRFVFWVPRPGPLERELEDRGYEVAGEPRLLRYSRAALSMPPGAARATRERAGLSAALPPLGAGGRVRPSSTRTQ